MTKLKRISVASAIFLAIFVCAAIILNPFSTNIAYAKADDTVFLGGYPIGIVAKTDGLVVSELVNVTSANGSFSPALQAGVQKGDIIIQINGQTVNDMLTLNEIIANSKGKIVLTIIRGGDRIEITIVPVFDLVQNALKIGLIVKNDLAGIGTMTYVTKDYQFGALGHLITDSYGYGDIYQKGKIYHCAISGFNVGKEGKAGELLGHIDLRQGAIGTMNNNNFSGIFGKYDKNKLTNATQVSVGSKNEVKAGKAYIYTTIDKEPPKMYEIEIIKVQKQESAAEKSMVIRVADAELKSKTGGILQGMSGSPILQNGKLVGAVTHVFISDPTKGYGIFVDWMMQNS